LQYAVRPISNPSQRQPDTQQNENAILSGTLMTKLYDFRRMPGFSSLLKLNFHSGFTREAPVLDNFPHPID
jgi:hypothetical protein